MKHLVKKEKKFEITEDDLFGNELIAYKCRSEGNAYAVLAKLQHSNWGFVPLNSSDSNPRYVAQSWSNAVSKASDCRNLKVFSNMSEMLNAIVNSEF